MNLRCLHPRPLCERLRDESGVALIVALSAMLIISVLAGTAVTLSLSTNQGSRYDVNQKQASEAAEAGLQVGLYRYNMEQPSNGDCVGSDGAVTPSSSTGATCASAVTTLGNGSTYQYFTTPVLSGSATCAGGTVSNTTGGVSNICITAVGTSNGVTARTQIRAASFAGSPLFAYPGMIGLKGITVENGSYSINAAAASNGPVTLSSFSLTGGSGYGLDLGPGASYSWSNGSGTTAPSETRLSSPIVLAPVNPGSSATTAINVDWPTDLTTATGIDVNSASASSKYYPVTYNATTRAMTADNDPTITLTGGVYNFCSFTAPSGVNVNVTAGASVAIYIDSSSDPDSGCPAGSGTLTLPNFDNLSDNPTALQLYVYGPTTVDMTEGSSFSGVLYAPTSTVELEDSSFVFDGGLAADDIILDNGATFDWGSDVSSLAVSPQGLYYRTAWTECTASFSSSAPESGCG